MLEFYHVNISCGTASILKDISVKFKQGEITTIIGPNGCGKTTLLQSLNGSSNVTSGSIILDGLDYLAMPLKERARRLSFLPPQAGASPQKERLLRPRGEKAAFFLRRGGCHTFPPRE